MNNAVVFSLFQKFAAAATIFCELKKHEPKTDIRTSTVGNFKKDTKKSYFNYCSLKMRLLTAEYRCDCSRGLPGECFKIPFFKYWGGGGG